MVDILVYYSEFQNLKTVDQKVKYLKVFPTLNHLPISKTKDFSLLNNTYHQSLELAPIVINSEESSIGYLKGFQKPDLLKEFLCLLFLKHHKK